MREEGYYWIQIGNGRGWEVAFFDGSSWWLVGGDVPLDEKDVKKINGNKLTSPE